MCKYNEHTYANRVVASNFHLKINICCFYRDVKTSRDTSRSTTRGRGRGAKPPNDRSNSNSSRGRNNNVISTVGLFSQGAGDGATKQLYRSFRGSDESSSAAQLRRPTLSAKREKVDPVAERQRIAEIYDLDGDVEESNGDEPMEGGMFAPIILTEREFFYHFHFFCC